jgi:hypothetical protein
MEKLGFVLTIAGFTLAASAYIWLLWRTFRVSEAWGMVLFFLPAVVPVYMLITLRRSWAPALLLLAGAGAVAAPHGIRFYQQRFVDLGERQAVVDGELHVTLTGWDRQDYSILEKMPAVVVLQMANPDVTDETLAYLTNMNNLRELDLNDTLVSDAGLNRLAELPKLQQLRLRNTRITDEGFRASIAPLESLRNVDVTGTKVKSKTLRDWKNAKPGRAYLN